MARFDKYDPFSGGFRAPLEAAVGEASVGVPLGVSLNASGRVVVGGAAATDIVGVICPVRPMSAGEPIDVMTAGEIVEVSGLTAGSRVYAATDGTVSTNATGTKLIGRAVEASRVVVRVGLA